MYKNSWVHYLTKVLVDVMFYGGIVACLLIPFSGNWVIENIGYTKDTIGGFQAVLISSGTLSVYILWQLKAMFKTLLGGNPFVSKNVNCFRKCSVASFLIAIIYLIKISVWFTIASSIIVVIFALLGLFCLTLKDVFKQAVYYKEENDGVI